MVEDNNRVKYVYKKQANIGNISGHATSVNLRWRQGSSESAVKTGSKRYSSEVQEKTKIPVLLGSRFHYQPCTPPS